MTTPTNQELRRIMTFMQVSLSRLESRVTSLEQALADAQMRRAVSQTEVSALLRKPS